ncbi:MFS-type transporter involved in bile tolerance, Atg22 family [Micromonospora echinaurantiaca]|uniref:MFS-type transporter involved in bile tolerance, Atg22 family n=1 Tax=Micromonospora echinaurantiaca TaxID=47857 RepID=A0A1C5I3C1_9ACTN|nr:MFS transporter [Micromonospora echinaurantiaca]SCG52788.1 MFS-type transporter involved in bile tolerance, Atg22 family [Micromonospora echinaurantiaca]
MGRQRLGRSFGWLWSAYAASTVGTWLGFGAFPLLAIQVLDVGPAAVSALAAAGLAVGALLALPLGPWVDRRRGPAVMIATNAIRCAALLSVPIAFWLGLLSYLHLLIVSVVGAAASIAFTAASGAYLKSIMRPDQLLVANGRFESTLWTATAVGPTLGGAAITLLGPVVTVVANAVGFLLSALGIGMIRDSGPRPAANRPPRPAGGGAAAGRPRRDDLLAGWRFILADRELRRLFLNTVTVNALIMATEPLLAVLLLGDLGWAAWQYGLAFGLPCVGGFVGAQLAPRLAARHGRRRVLLVSGVLRALWPVGLVLVVPGTAGVVLVIAVELVLITCMGVFNPLFATERLQRVPADRIARVLVAWRVTGAGTIALLTALWGVLAAATGARAAIGLAGAALLATPLLLPHRGSGKSPRGEPVPPPLAAVR